MEVHVKGSPNIEVTFESKVIKVEGGIVDTALSLESENPVMNKVITEELNKKASNDIVEEISSNISNIQSTLSSKADTNGTYPEMSVGIAEDLMGRPFTVDSAFTFRPTAGAENEIKDDYARIESIKGNSVVWNQIANANKTSGTNTSISDRHTNGFSVSAVAGSANKNAMLINLFPNNHMYYLGFAYTSNIVYSLQNMNASVALDASSVFVNVAFIGTRYDTAHTSCYWYIYNAISEPWSLVVKDLVCYDLTQMFGAGNEPSTVEEFYARIPQNIDLNAYNEGEVIHNNTDAIKSVGFNQWDEEWESGSISVDTGENTSSTRLRSKNFIRVSPLTTYYAKYMSGDDYFNIFFYDKDLAYIGYNAASGSRNFETPFNCTFIKFYCGEGYGSVYKNDICINLSDSSRNGTYEPYISREQRLDIIGKYFPNGMKSAGTAHDEIRYNKATQKWEAVKRIAEVDLGALGWSVDGNRFSAAVLGAASAKTTAISNIICSKYNSVSPVDTYIGKTGISSNTIKNYIYIADSSFTEASALKSSLQGVIAYYELAEPIVTEIEEDINLDYEVWNGGTEQAIADTPSTPFSAVIEYDFNANETIRQNKADINKIKRALQELKFDFMLPVTYSELVEMRDRGELVAGMQYRITDYVTTTIQENTQSAGHAFDVIVMATDNKTLSEEARAIVHEGDTYFTEAGANLAAWKLWYCLDNDAERFAWADAENGKGVIYRLIDEWNNDCPYDFKNIQFKRNLTFENGYAEFSEDGEETWVYTFAGQSYHVNNDAYSDMLDGSLESPYGHMSDEGTSTFHDNIIKPYIMVYNGNDVYTECGIRYLNDNVFLGYWEEIGSANEEDAPYYFAYCCYNNSFGNNCYNNSFSNNCYNNSFGNNCYNNSFSNNCYNNSFGNNCHNNSFSNNCYNNSFGSDCQGNSLYEVLNTTILSGVGMKKDIDQSNVMVATNSQGEVKVFNIADLVE